MDDDDYKVKVRMRYECPITCAHFNFTEMCGKLNKLIKKREQDSLLKP